MATRLIVILQTFSLLIGCARVSLALCNGKFTYKPCCVGERWNSTDGKCVACPFDHYGENCTSTCNPPEQGYRCMTGGCQCNKLTCNVSIKSPGCLTSKKIFEDKSIVSTLSINTSNRISKGVDNSTLSHSSTSGDLFSISPIQDRKKWRTVYTVFIVFGACLLLLFSLFVMERTGFMNKKKHQKVSTKSTRNTRTFLL